MLCRFHHMVIHQSEVLVRLNDDQFPEFLIIQRPRSNLGSEPCTSRLSNSPMCVSVVASNGITEAICLGVDVRGQRSQHIKVAIFLVEVQTVTDDEFIRNILADISHIDINRQGLRLTE